MDKALIRQAKFFQENAGYVVGERAAGALKMARAALRAEELGIVYKWTFDEDADLSWMSDEERAKEHEALGCTAILPCEECSEGDEPEDCWDARTLASLWGITDADANYRKVIEGEMALEAVAVLDREAK